MSNGINSDSVNQLLLSTGLGAFELRTDLNVSAKTQGSSTVKSVGRAVSQDFETDLKFAGKRALGSLADMLGSARDLDHLFTAVDGLTAKDRYPSDQVQLLNIVYDLVSPDKGLRFHAAINETTVSEPGTTPAMDYDCACVIEPKLSQVYVSADLGFRDLFQVSQRAVAAGLVLRAADAGLAVDPYYAIPQVAALLGHDTVPTSDTVTSWLSTAAGRQTVQVIAFHDST